MWRNTPFADDSQKNMVHIHLYFIMTLLALDYQRRIHDSFKGRGGAVVFEISDAFYCNLGVYNTMKNDMKMTCQNQHILPTF